MQAEWWLSLAGIMRVQDGHPETGMLGTLDGEVLPFLVLQDPRPL